ncbi:MAG: hypothetical protein WDO56_16310 [Gammaproteobacteria bacterium]
MYSHKRHIGKLATSAAAIAASSILSIAAAQAAETSTPMVLTAYINAAGGESVLKGNYDTALAEIRRDHSVNADYSAKMTNLCVTYAAKKDLAQAKNACDSAVQTAKSERISAQRYAAGTVQENGYVAIAYTNRAVVHMMSKDSASARSDLARAKSLAPSAEFVSKNLAAVENTGSKIAQLSVAPSR